MFVQLLEALVLVILTSDIRAELAETLELLLRLLCGGLDVGLYPLKVLLVVHFRSRIANDLDVFRKELVAVLEFGQGLPQLLQVSV